ncbi:unnamed protein product, partial [Ectocarpus sp. 8 AP-2014]
YTRSFCTSNVGANPTRTQHPTLEGEARGRVDLYVAQRRASPVYEGEVEALFSFHPSQWLYNIDDFSIYFIKRIRGLNLEHDADTNTLVSRCHSVGNWQLVLSLPPILKISILVAFREGNLVADCHRKETDL